MSIEITPGFPPGVIETSSTGIIPKPTLPGTSTEEDIYVALWQLAESEPDAIKENLELHRICNQYKVGMTALKKMFPSIKADFQRAKEVAAIPEPTEEELRAREQAVQAAQEEQAQIANIVALLQQSPDLLPNFHALLVQSGYVCDELLAGSLWLSHGSRLLPTSSAFFFTGASGSGKTDALLKAAAFLPPEIVISLTSVSDQALHYIGDIQHRYLIFGEIAPRIDEQDDVRQMAMRQLISENKITRLVVEKVDGKSNVAVLKVTEGPCTVVATTSREQNQFDDELQNRASWVLSNDSNETTIQVLSVIATRAENPVQPDDTNLSLRIRAFQEFHRNLESLEVIIPFAHKIQPTGTHVTVRRLYNMVLNYIRANALLHQHSRETKIIDGKKVVIATHDDYKLAYRVLTANAPRVLETCPAPARKAFDEKLKPALADDKPRSTGQIVQILQRPEKTVNRWLRSYAKSGLLTCLDYKDKKQNLYMLVPDAPDHFTQDLGLVSPDQVLEITFADLI